MTARDYMAFIEDMINAIDKILKYIDTVDGISGFLANEMVVEAVT